MSLQFTPENRRELAGRARTLHERLAGPGNEPGERSVDVDRFLAEWRDLFPDERSFVDRLERDGYAEARIREQASATHWPADEPLPDWVADLETLLEYVEATGPGENRSVEVPEDTAFGELLAAVVEFACEALPVERSPAGSLSPMVEWLFDRLESLCVRALYVEFRSFLVDHGADLADADPSAVEDPPTEYYDRFVEAMLEFGTRNLCLEYPVLARQLMELVDQWVGAVTETCERLRRDRPALEDRFGVEGPVTELEPLAMDTHQRGRVPIRIAFESGSVVYKPRGVGGGVAFHAALERLADHLPTPVRTPNYLPRDGYGWMEVIRYRDLDDSDAAVRYYERAGVVLCLAYALGLVDCQFENVLAAGEHPTIVDAETVFHSPVDPTDQPFPTSVADTVARSVLLTGLLPFSADEDDSTKAAVAGFGTGSGRESLSGRKRPTIEAVNTDVMRVGERTPTFDTSDNTPSVAGEDHPPSRHIDALDRGFDRAYDAIGRLHADDRFFGDVVDEESIEGIETRLIYRSTSVYHSVLRSTTARDPLRDGVWLSLELERLAVPFFDGRIGTDTTWPLYAAERRALRRRDFPRFTTTPHGTAPHHDGRTLDVRFATSGYERAQRRVDGFDDDDRSHQSWIVRRSYTSSPTPPSPPDPAEVTDERLRQVATDLFEDVVAATVDSPGEGWTLLTPTGSQLHVTPADYSVYYGRSGVALAAAALYATTGDGTYRDLVTELLTPVTAGIEPDTPSYPLGGPEGIGGVVYTLSTVGELLDEPKYVRHANDAASTVTDDLVADDGTFDVMDGSAGTALGLLAHHERHGRAEVLERAVACGERLLDARTTVDGHRVWRTVDDDAMIGFSHGSAGIAYALARLTAATGDERYVAAVREALAFESRQYDPERANWPYGARTDRYMDRWCHGRSGIVLARMGIARSLDEGVLPTPPGAVLSEIAGADPAPLDDLCCGNLGRIEALLAGSRRAGCDRSDALTLVGRCLARRERDGQFSLHGRAGRRVSPAFYKGTSGAVYTLLRLRSPETLSCVPLFE